MVAYKGVITVRKAIGLVALKNQAILLVEKRDIWILPGGKPEGEETDTQCLIREIGEELPGLQLANIRFYDELLGQAPHRGDIISVHAYFADIQGDIRPAAEITNAAWVSEFSKYPLADITKKIIAILKRDGYLI